MILVKNLLFYIFLLPLIGTFVLIATPSRRQLLLKQIAFLIASLTFVSSLLLWIVFNESIGTFQFVTKILWVDSLNLNLTLGVDGISVFFLLLTTMLIPLCLLVSWNSISFNLKEYLISFLVMEFFLIGVFCVLDLLLFYIFFESVLIPMFLIIGIWGSRERKIRAAYFFFLYTLLGSVLMLLSILYIYYQVGTTDYEVLITFSFSPIEQQLMWFTFFASFATKVPMVPVHLWLPEAHVEAPTAGSVILAGVLLKLGTYGFIRFSLPLFPEACFYFAPLIYAFSAIGVVYTSFTAIRQTDFKRIIAYTSVAHMNLVMLGIFSFNVIGIEGAILQSLSHGFVASALFLIIGVVYALIKLTPVSCRFALIFCGGYLLLGYFQLQRAEIIMHELAEKRGHVVERFMVKPTIGNLVLWRSIYLSHDEFYIDAIRVGIENKIYEGEAIKQFETSSLPEKIDKNTTLYNDIKRFQFFSDNFVIWHPDKLNALGDVRYAMSPTSVIPLWGIELNYAEPDKHVKYEFYREIDDKKRQAFVSMLFGAEI